MKKILIAFLVLFSQYAYSQVGVATADTSLRATVSGTVQIWKSKTYYASLFATIYNKVQSDNLLATKIGLSQKGNALGVATLDGSQQVPIAQIPSTIARTSDLSGYVPTTRTVTINGVSQDLSVNRSWTIPSADSTVYRTVANSLSLSQLQTKFNLKANTGGGNATGTWPISITGNSANATTWNGAVFDGQSVLTGTYTYILGYNGTKWMPSSAAQVQTFLGLGSNAYTSTAYTPTARTITINGVTQDLSANRTFTVTSSTPTLDQVLTAGASSNQTAGFGNVNVIGNVTTAGYNATSGTVANAPTASTDVVNKSYADALGKEFLTVNSWGSNPTLYITGSSFYAGGSVSVVYIDCSTGNKTLYLPTIADMFGRKVVVYKTDASANTATITSTAALNINGSPTYTLTTQYQSVEIRAGNNGYTTPNQYYAR